MLKILHCYHMSNNASQQIQGYTIAVFDININQLHLHNIYAILKTLATSASVCLMNIKFKISYFHIPPLHKY